MRKSLLYTVFVSGTFAVIVILALPGSALQITNEFNRVSAPAKAAAIFFVESITVAQIQNDYHAVSTPTEKKVKILIVPGHEPDSGGAEFNGIYERNIVVDIANALADLLRQNPHYEVMVARTKVAWNPILQSYFDTNAAAIQDFRTSQATMMAQYLAQGSVALASDQIGHSTTSTKGALELYGINKWASENHYGITLHLHLNDYSGHPSKAVGKYDGFAVYIPDRQYSNAEASRVIGNALAVRLNAYHATSTLPKEDVGVVPDQQLIAIGSNNSADGASLLIEYGYLYEPQFQHASVRGLAVADYARATYLGLQDFFTDPVSSTYGSAAIPYDWTSVSVSAHEKSPDVYALQSALHHLGYYPPAERSFSECPISGIAGSCTTEALAAYQTARGIDATGTLGPLTRAALTNDLAAPSESPSPVISYRTH